MEMQQVGKFLIFLGLVLVILGLVLLFGKPLSFLGRLPGDIRVQRPNFVFYFPITTSLLLSLFLTLILYLISRIR